MIFFCGQNFTNLHHFPANKKNLGEKTTNIGGHPAIFSTVRFSSRNRGRNAGA